MTVGIHLQIFQSSKLLNTHDVIVHTVPRFRDQRYIEEGIKIKPRNLSESDKSAKSDNYLKLTAMADNCRIYQKLSGPLKPTISVKSR